MRRIRETLFKLIVIVGVCKPLEAIFDIDAITNPEDKDYTFSRYVIRRCHQGIVKADNRAEKDGNVTRQTQNVVQHGKVACTSTTRKASITC
jgi:hypothetical protein